MVYVKAAVGRKYIVLLLLFRLKKGKIIGDIFEQKSDRHKDVSWHFVL